MLQLVSFFLQLVSYFNWPGIESLASLSEGMYVNLLGMKSGKENDKFAFVTDKEFSYSLSVNVNRKSIYF